MTDQERAEMFVDRATREVVTNTGQIDHGSKLALERAVRRGEIAKWRGHWFPVAGAQWGMGQLKTCYGPVATGEYLRASAGV